MEESFLRLDVCLFGTPGSFSHENGTPEENISGVEVLRGDRAEVSSGKSRDEEDEESDGLFLRPRSNPLGKTLLLARFLGFTEALKSMVELVWSERPVKLDFDHKAVFPPTFLRFGRHLWEEFIYAGGTIHDMGDPMQLMAEEQGRGQD